jgi:FixJ family two-component response regulator
MTKFSLRAVGNVAPQPHYHEEPGKLVAKVPMISIVDDDKSIRDATEGLVRSLGYRTATFESAEAFIDSDRLKDTVCLITDVQMPGLTGLDLQDHLNAHGRLMPVIFVTAFPDDGIRARALKAGAVGFFRKPFDEDKLVECLDLAVAANTRQP